MKEIKVWINNGETYQFPHYIQSDKMFQYIAEWKQTLFQKCKEANADHYVYAIVTLDDDNGILPKELDIYMMPLNNDDFHKRMEKIQREKKVMVYAWHKGTAY